MRALPFRTRVIAAVELTALLASIALAILWMREPTGPYEPYFAATALLFLITEAFRRYEGKLFRTEGVERTPAERLRHYNDLREKFKEEIARCRAQNLRKDVIIRHVNRMDHYPITDTTRGISPWFKAGLLDTYHSGILVGLGWNGLIKAEGSWRKPDCQAGETAEVTVMLVGEIPYDLIESMNVDGNEYYNLPHIFCHFANHGEPYQRLFYAERVEMGHGHEYWKEVVAHQEVARRSKALAS